VLRERGLRAAAAAAASAVASLLLLLHQQHLLLSQQPAGALSKLLLRSITRCVCAAECEL
jgi:hypothetical protein